jgi:YD repeat-containing protein
MVRTTPIGPAVLVGLALALAPQVRAADTEVRTFNVSVDGKPSGQYTMTFTREADGSVRVGCDAHVKVTVLRITAYHYDYTGNEVWKDGRLISLQSTCDDDGKKFTVGATADGGQLRVKVNGREKLVRGDAYLTSACCLPDAGRREGALPLLEADNGQEIDGKMQQVSSGPMNVNGQVVTVTRYRLTSLVPHELWYDASDRMVRQEWTEDGHKTVLELASIQKR